MLTDSHRQVRAVTPGPRGHGEEADFIPGRGGTVARCKQVMTWPSGFHKLVCQSSGDAVEAETAVKGQFGGDRSSLTQKTVAWSGVVEVAQRRWLRQYFRGRMNGTGR